MGETSSSVERNMITATYVTDLFSLTNFKQTLYTFGKDTFFDVALIYSKS